MQNIGILSQLKQISRDITLIKTFFLFLFFFNSSLSTCQNLPLWEVGAGFLAFRADHYRGSDQHKDYFFPGPYMVYRGKKVKAENSFVEGRFLKWGPYQLKLSLSLGLPVRSKDNHARQGMNNIYPTFEVGFLSELFLWSSKNQKVRLNFRWPIRQVIATDFREFDDAGIYSVPYLALSIMPQENTLGWGIEPSLAVMWGSQRYHQYFYGVPSVHARPDRPFYQGKRGFSGTQLSVVLSKRYKNLMFFPFIRYDILKGAVFEDSPLVRKKNYLLGGIGLAWLFISSKEKQSGQTVR